VPDLSVQDVNRLVAEHGGTVLVADGEPNYHVDGCARLPDAPLEEADVLVVRDEGFTACRTCRPNRVLAEQAQQGQGAIVPQPSPRLPAPPVPPAPPPAPASPPPVYGVAVPAQQQPEWTPAGRQFVFDGGAGTYLGTALLAFVITVFTLGVAYPFALVLRERWRAKHSFINGQRLKFTGTGTGLFGLWIKWFLLSVVTVGIYLFWVGPRIARWKWQHTGFENQVMVRPAQ